MMTIIQEMFYVFRYLSGNFELHHCSTNFQYSEKLSLLTDDKCIETIVN